MDPMRRTLRESSDEVRSMLIILMLIILLMLSLYGGSDIKRYLQNLEHIRRQFQRLIRRIRSKYVTFGIHECINVLLGINSQTWMNWAQTNRHIRLMGRCLIMPAVAIARQECDLENSLPKCYLSSSSFHTP